MLTSAGRTPGPRPGTQRHVVALGAVVALFAVLAVLVALGAGGGLDWTIYTAVIARRHVRLDAFFTPFTSLGGWYVVAPVAGALAAGFALTRRRREAALLVLAPACALALNILLKLIVHRAPPGGDDDDLVAHARYSFPSGHTMTTTALATALVFVAWPTRWRWPVTAGATLFAATMGLSRVYVGVHWPSDVVAGWLMGAAAAWLVWLVLRPKPTHAREAVEIAPDDTTRAGQTPPHTLAVAGTTGQVPADPLAPACAAGQAPSPASGVRVVLFDWGNTLMVDDGQPGRMADWPRVAAVPGAAEALAALFGSCRLCVATNADESGAHDVMAALGRVGLARFIDRVFSSRDIGARKPDPAFYAAVLEALSSDAAARGEPPLRPDQVLMVGDSYVDDVAGAKAAGLRTIWFAHRGREGTSLRATDHDAVVTALGDVPGALERLGRR